ncbi:hypothetical protein [Fructobacillus cardui]|uniref:DNA-directed RNA polymerase specialized sigma subunit (FliA) n=1 Tax=Fructobacillus cardui TaxID=2893170 RepID=A0ABM9MUF8_9LACO|nr:DNA-directed RNA polymerase specialized sigma subunit (FliA) [Fructobacillus cardui]
MVQYDREQTIKNVSEFFGNPLAVNKPSEFKDLMDLAQVSNVDSLYHSPVINDMPTGSDEGNRVDKAVVELIGNQEAKHKMKLIKTALHNMDDRYGRVIYLRHFQSMAMIDIAERIGYSSSNVDKLLETAYYKFALWTEEFLKLTCSVGV